VNHPGPDLYVIGAGGHAREVHAYIQDLVHAGWKGTLKGFFDDGLAPGPNGRLEVLGPLAQSTFSSGALSRSARYITALGNNPTRREMVSRVDRLSANTLAAWTLVHPKAWIGEDVEIGEGTCIAPAAIVTANVRLGRHSIINIKASISHDCSVGDFVNINPAATICGWVTIGEGAFIGAGATVKDRISIGAWSIIGAGAVVTRDVSENVTVVGVPARVVKNKGLL
jgi:sugar O-acyltransferase (sialic acid O-acetyltransferase NeuD family)